MAGLVVCGCLCERSEAISSCLHTFPPFILFPPFFAIARRPQANAVKTQIWIAVCVYVLVAILKKRLDLDQQSTSATVIFMFGIYCHLLFCYI